MIRPKKSLGQNWLRSASALQAIISAAQLAPADTVLEIGPGAGVLTEALLAAGAKQIIAVEKDDRLIEPLEKKFANEIAAKKLVLIHDDILKSDLSRWLQPTDHWKLVANLPYYLTGQVLRRLMWEELSPALLVVMLQKEVAERIVARDGKESLLSISVKAAGEPKYVKTVPAGAFYPVPAVDSAILAIYQIKPLADRNLEPSHFFELLHRGFAHKRKLVASNLGCSTATLTTCKIEPLARAENLSVADWLCLNQLL